ncbi:MAG TPA: BON domain-containing protein [Terriglobales bacterium]
MFRISACASFLLCAVFAWGQQPQNFGQTPPAAPPRDASQQAKTAASSEHSNDLRGALRACASLLLAATSVRCSADASQQPTPQAQANSLDKAAANSQRGDLQGTLRACAVLLMAATSGTCSEDASQQPPPPPSPAQRPAPSQYKAPANSQIQSTLQSALDSDPGLNGTDVEVSVDDVNLTLTGSVQTQAQLNRVFALASPYADYRSVVNKVAVH